MAEQITGARQLIEDRGGCAAVSKALGWPYTTVHTFHRNDQAPKYRWDAIMPLPMTPKGSPTPAHPQEAA